MNPPNTQKYNPSDLRQYSLITWSLERIFFFLQQLSIATWISNTRINAQKDFEIGDTDKAAITIHRGRRIELYVISWLAVEAALIFFTKSPKGYFGMVASSIAAYRLADLLQANLNLNIFDRLRTSARQLYVATLARTVILSVWNFFEAIICFGIIYACNLDLLNNHGDVLGAYYFSSATQLTIGYGDVTPRGSLRLVAMCQGAFGFVLGLLSISRLISFLPKKQSVLGDE